MKNFMLIIALILTGQTVFGQNPTEEVSKLSGHIQNYKDLHTLIMQETINDDTKDLQEKMLQYQTEMDKLKKDFTDKRLVEYRSLERTVQKGHSCTKGYSGGTKKCGTKCANAPSPAWRTKIEWTNVIMGEGNQINASISGNGDACVYLQKSGKGRIALTIVSKFKVREEWLLKQVEDDKNYVFTEVTRLSRGSVKINDN